MSQALIVFSDVTVVCFFDITRLSPPSRNRAVVGLSPAFADSGESSDVFAGSLRRRGCGEDTGQRRPENRQRNQSQIIELDTGGRD
jgi:hypothetical protein